MASYRRFEDLPVWQAAAELYDRTDDLLASAPQRLRYSFKDQLERAVVSISNNIAEGFERGTKAELLSFIYIARGSAGEVRSMLTILLRRPWLPTDFKSRIFDLKPIAESISKQLHGWAESLQNSDIQGQRHQNEKTRSNYDKAISRKQGIQNFRKMLHEHLSADHPLRQKP